MEDSKIFSTVSTLIYPFLLMFGFYIVINGDLSPGGGFQGGVIFATSFFIRYLISKKDPFSLILLARIEKILYIFILLFISLSMLTKAEMFTNFIISEEISYQRLFLVALNFLIGLKVTAGVISIISSFIEEGEL
ncbi:MAG: MnhB domain-containing protein [Clostridiales bacterium]|nr:MnhB domain-containing protein [Clostridiales bacterium]